MGKMTACRKDCAALAGKSTLNRLELAPEEGEAFAPARYHKTLMGKGFHTRKSRRKLNEPCLTASVIALGLEVTLISNAVSCLPRPGLSAFLDVCQAHFDRVVLFSRQRGAGAADPGCDRGRAFCALNLVELALHRTRR